MIILLAGVVLMMHSLAQAEPTPVFAESLTVATGEGWERPTRNPFARSGTELSLRSGGQEATTPPPRKGKGSVLRSVLFGALAGAGGFAAGAALGSGMSHECDNASDLCIENAAILGAAGGGTLGMTLGVHLGNDRRGSLGKDLLAATGVWALGVTLAMVTASSSDDAAVAILVAIPIVQLGVTVAVERTTGRSE